MMDFVSLSLSLSLLSSLPAAFYEWFHAISWHLLTTNNVVGLPQAQSTADP